MEIDKVKKLDEILRQVNTCQKCRLYKTAKNAVPGEGNPHTEIAFVGEAPGATEDETGRPFVGRAGKLLENLLGKIGLKRSDVWIGNIIKHRPPENRDPLPDEIIACQPYLTEQLKIISPLLVVTLGRFAMGYFYHDGKITRDHGQLIRLKTYQVFPVYHPAAALRNPDMAATLEADFIKIPGVLKSIKEGKMDRKAENNEEKGLQDRDENQLLLF